MRKWWMGAAWAVGLLFGASAANAQDIPFPGPQGAPTPPPDPTYAVPPEPPAAPAVTPGGGDRGYDNAFDQPPCCLPLPRFHADLEYLAWWTKHDSLPVLATTGDPLDLNPGALGQPGTRTAIAGSQDELFHNGGRLSLAYDLCEGGLWTVQGSAFILEGGSASSAVSESGALGTQVLARPFFNLATGVEDAFPVAQPGVASGAIQVGSNDRLYGGDANIGYQFWSDDSRRLVFLVGARYLRLTESLSINAVSQDLPSLGVAGNTTLSSDEYNTVNQFYGAQLGAEYEFRLGPVSAALAGKVAVGPMQRTVQDGGFTLVTDPTGQVVSSTNRSLYVSPNNAGTFKNTSYAVVPEGNVRLGYDFNDHVRLSVGYTFLYVGTTARPSDQIDRNVNTSGANPTALVPGSQTSEFWAQGLDVGLQFSF